MSIPAAVKRCLRLCGDFEYAMPVIAYYLKLYVVEEFLGLQERNEEVIANATRLLDDIEQFKQSVQDEAEQHLLKDQQKAKVYCMNFTLSLYNEQLSKVQNKLIAGDLARALWCCIDLFSAILALWGKTEATADEVTQCQKRIKVCKLFLSKLARGELGSETVEKSQEPEYKPEQVVCPQDSDMGLSSTEQNDVEVTDDEDDDDGDEAIEQTSQPESQPEVDPVEVESFLKSLEQDPALAQEIEDKNPSSDNDNGEDDNGTQHLKDTEELIRKMRELGSEPAPPSTDSEPELQLPQAPTEIGRLPDFEEAAQPTIDIQKPVHFKPDDLKAMWNREDQIAVIQKAARFAISALNYEDLKTAKRELTKALQQLEELEG
ncbi:LAME_0G01640g1_1 [Lachancea meyersii CBS 8951]|uniref:LAME_0G01640g1_1 n=1 Tax=Lachancea meyersii CBS 8951 TaxID=1266667 RepID=A0A1G4K5G7_9SACH|nr:LAME_0G01640g1_1 [Lachancea meyersii CBS 8951]